MGIHGHVEVLSENRDLQAQVEEAEKMLTEIDVTRLPSYRIGFEAGEANGEARGRDAEKQAIVRQLLRQFDSTRVAQLLGLDVSEVEGIATSRGEPSSARTRAAGAGPSAADRNGG